MDGSHLTGNNRNPKEGRRPSDRKRFQATIRIRTLMFGLLIMVSVFILSFAAIFLY